MMIDTEEKGDWVDKAVEKMEELLKFAEEETNEQKKEQKAEGGRPKQNWNRRYERRPPYLDLK